MYQLLAGLLLLRCRAAAAVTQATFQHIPKNGGTSIEHFLHIDFQRAQPRSSDTSG